MKTISVILGSLCMIGFVSCATDDVDRSPTEEEREKQQAYIIAELNRCEADEIRLIRYTAITQREDTINLRTGWSKFALDSSVDGVGDHRGSEGRLDKDTITALKQLMAALPPSTPTRSLFDTEFLAVRLGKDVKIYRYSERALPPTVRKVYRLLYPGATW